MVGVWVLRLTLVVLGVLNVFVGLRLVWVGFWVFVVSSLGGFCDLGVCCLILLLTCSWI